MQTAEFLNFGPDIVGSDQRFSDEHGVDSHLKKLFDMAAVLNAAFADDDPVRWNTRSQPFGNGEICRKRGEVSVVDPDHSGVGNPFKDRIEFTLMVNFYQHIK